MSCFNEHRVLRTLQLACLTAAIAAAAGCKGPDPSSFACTSSQECPGDYHCDLGTASTTGSLKCLSGAPTPRTLAADATKFFLSRHPESDGSTRTTVLAGIGAVTSTPDFVGVRVIASQGGKDLANAPVAADGSALEFQLPQATAQVSLRVQDDSGHSIPVTGYSEEIELSFVGKEVAGSTNGAAAYDVTNQNDALFPPATWIASGPGPGGAAQEFTRTDTSAQATGSYASIAYSDYHAAATTSPAVPSLTATPVGWQSITQFPTTAQPSGSPPARTGTALASADSGFFLFGGRDSANAPADPQGAFWQYNFFGFAPGSSGWTFSAAPPGPLPSARSGAAAGARAQFGGGTCFLNGFTLPCTIDDRQIVIAGGAGPTGTATNELQLFHRTSSFTTDFNTPSSIVTSWQLVGTLPFPNAGMQSAAGIVLFNATVAGISSSQPYAGGMMIYGQAVTAANSGTQGCVLFGASPVNATTGSPPQAIPIQNAAVSCVGSPPFFDSATGGIGFRTGATLVSDNANPTNFYVFGGRKTTGATTALQNDIWKATVSCPGSPAVCATTTTWQQISGSGVPPNFPTPRSGAGGGIFANGKLAIYGGTDAGGNLSDLWEFDLGANTWRLATQDTTANVLSPSTRTGFAMTGDSQRIYTFGGTLAAGSVTDQAWMAGHESAAKLLVKLPFSLPQLDQARNVKLTVDAQGINDIDQAFVWDGTNWRLIGSFDFTTTGHILATTSGPATSLLQPDGNIYLLIINADRAQFNFGTGFQAPVSIDRLKVTVDFQ